MIQAQIFYSGVVQGVGFRYSVQHMANDLKLAGWVRNLHDRRVEILVEGPKSDVERFCQEIDRRFEGNIRDKQISYHPSQGHFKNFQITHTV